MAIIRTNVVIESVQFIHDADGAITAVHLNRTFSIADDAALDAAGAPTVIASGLRDAPNVWPLLTAAQRAAANTISKRLATLTTA